MANYYCSIIVIASLRHPHWHYHHCARLSLLVLSLLPSINKWSLLVKSLHMSTPLLSSNSYSKTLLLRVRSMPEHLQPYTYLNDISFKWEGIIITSELKNSTYNRLKNGQFSIEMLKVNCFILTVVFHGCQRWDFSGNYIDDICVEWLKAVRQIFNLPYITYRYQLPLIGLTGKFLNTYTRSKCHEVEVANGAMRLSWLNVRCTVW